MQATVREHGAVLVMEPQDKRLDAHAAADFKSGLVGFIDGGKRQVVLNLRQVAFIDSSGLGAIVSGLKHVGPEGELKVCALHPTVRAMFELTRLHRVIAIFDTEEEALRSFGT